MIAIIGIVIVVASVLGGFSWAGGPLYVLVVPSEYLVIGGTAVGTILISTPRPILISMMKQLTGVVKPNPFNAALYLDALKVLYELFQLARKDGLVAIESHIEEPDSSDLFQKYPKILKQHHPLEFLCDSLRLVLVGSVPPHDLDMMMDAEIDAHHHEQEAPVEALTKVGDSLPGIGIVAAVLGIVVTMQSIAGPVEVIGHHVAAALVGTFLGILLSYGFVAPMASKMSATNSDESRFFGMYRSAVTAFAKGFAPIIVVEFARRAVPGNLRPTFTDMEEACKNSG